MNEKMLNSLVGIGLFAVAAGFGYVVYTTIRHAPNPSPLEARIRARIAARAIDREWYRIVKDSEVR